MDDFSCCSSLRKENFRNPDTVPIIDCTFYEPTGPYQSIPSCYSSSIFHNEIYSSSSETKFLQIRNYLNDVRCKMLTRLVQRNITGVELIRAFEEAPKVIEKMYTSNANTCNDKFIDQLVNVTHDIIIESPYKCPPVLKSSHPRSDISINYEFQFSPPPPIKVLGPPPPPPKAKVIPPPLPPVKSKISSPPASNPVSPRRSSEDQPLTMGYQWKGEDN